MCIALYKEFYQESNPFGIFSDSKSALQTMLSKWDHDTVQTIMIF